MRRDRDLLLVNGDSYSAPFGNQEYGARLSAEMKLPLVNLAKAGSNNDRIFRSTIEAVNHFTAQQQKVFVVLALSFVRRTEVWITDANEHGVVLQKEQFPEQDREHLVLPTFTLDWVQNLPRLASQFKHLVVDDFNVHKKLLDFYTQIFLVSNFFKMQNIPYVIFSAARNTDCPVNCFPAIQNLSMVQQVIADPAVVPLHDDCFLDWASRNDPDANVTGHLSAVGHAKYALELHERIRSIYGT